MIRLFRNIRKKLAGKNKFIAYSRYAIGEIILVVIGILIALQVNNWNENRKENQVEIKYLSNLKHDLQKDSINLNKLMTIRFNKVSAAKKILLYAQLNDVTNIFEIDSLYIDVAYWLEHVPNDNSCKELISSGNLNIIKNDTIKNLLLDLSNKNEEIVNDRNHMRREYEKYLYDKRTEVINFFEINDASKNKISDDWFYPDKQTIDANTTSLRKDYLKLFEDNTFLTGLAYAAGNNLYLIDQYHIMLAQIYSLIKLIDNELKNNL